ncbi:MAG: hypothetical protein GF418_09665 [Chitinivibrionales bacterium]|nr:hypothetical protein [Chitinivibrionales bacterium]MBD3395877.1 hypothetical protein [Chitinivibrionales bacterium]
MKALLVVHSKTGHTILFARAIGERLREDGHDVDIKLLRTKGASRPYSRDVELIRPPDPSEYDIVLAGSPVHGGTASPAALAYLEELENLKGKRCAPFATFALPFGGFGGCRRTLARLSGKLEALGATVVEGEGMFWMFGPNKTRMREACERIASRLKQ